MDITKKVKNQPDVIENVDFAIPAHFPEEALEKSKIYGPDGVLQEKVFALNKNWR